jgi:uncharacterized glyoxalase superfamily protein PhnB
MTLTDRRPTMVEIAPLLVVAEIYRSLDFYCRQLGFKITNSYAPHGKLCWCRVERDSTAILLQLACEQDGPASGRGRGVTFYLTCDDADAICAEFRAAGLHVEPPKVTFYGMNQLFVNDPDGYVLCFQNDAERR